jgi:NAD(P)-dependent dehydrogenase (short-subunit alcohol dehydrogenase family)
LPEQPRQGGLLFCGARHRERLHEQFNQTLRQEVGQPRRDGGLIAENDQTVQQLSVLVSQYGQRVRTAALDVTNPEQACAAMAAALETFGRLDVVVNNAAYRYYAAIEDANEAELRAELETDLWGVIHVTRAALPILHQQRSGHIVQFSSIAGRLGLAGLGPYNMAKAAVDSFSEALAREVASLGVKVTIIEPGAFRTEFSATAKETKETPPSADYQSAVGQTVSTIKQRVGHEPGDPAKAAQAIIAVVNAERSPLRLLLGRDAVQVARQLEQADLAEIERWEQLSTSTDFEDITNQAESGDVIQAMLNPT